MANVFILRTAAAGDRDVKTGYADVELQNGYAVALGDFSMERGTRGAFEVAAPAAETDRIGLVYNADVPALYDSKGVAYRGLTHDPRDIKFGAGTIVNIHMPSKHDEYAFTEVKGTAAGATHVVFKAGSMEAEYATSTDDALLALKITGTGFVSIGGERVPTVEVIY